MACGCGCNGAANGCGSSSGLSGFGEVPYNPNSEMDGWLKGMMPMIIIGGIGLFFLWRR